MAGRKEEEKEPTLEDSRISAVALRELLIEANEKMVELHTILDHDIDLNRSTKSAADEPSTSKATVNIRLDLHTILEDCIDGDKGAHKLLESIRSMKLKFRSDGPPKELAVR
jgi:hypothetical protein